MTRYDEAFLDELATLMRLATGRYFWLSALLTLIPTALLFKVDSGVLFLLYFAVVCMLTRSVRMGGLIVCFIAAQSVFMYYNLPQAGHFIEILLRAPGHSAGTVPSSEKVLSSVPASLSGQLFFALVFGIRAGIVGLGLGFLGRKLLPARLKE